ncbi:MAG: winged helix-turn-helix transcriptional regulator [Planctomycetes bacterium]|nr:winged helix-turn-helix transcriptional regulator [Planctomycetota bacterium]MCP4861184.1 winged helix-turn-helix transcriptional regulator [Planctomycetota bacterium]
MTSEDLAPQCCPELQEALDPKLFHALADQSRLVLLMRLVVIEQPQTVSELADCCGVHLSGVSRHLAMLRDAGILDAQKSGREVRYELRREELANTLRLIADAIEI